MFTRRWLFLAGVILFVASAVVPFAVRVAAGVLGLSQDNRYDTTYYTDLAAVLALILGCLLIVAGIFFGRRPAGK
jgi:hypothetical protein